jgi:hypothetical protein
MANLAVATEIRRQLYAGGMTKVWSWGSHAWKGGDNFLTFRVTGHLFRGVVKITLNSLDLYDIELMKLNGTVEKTINNIYNDQLTDVIDRVVERIPQYKD